jgi:hypothetical protein
MQQLGTHHHHQGRSSISLECTIQAAQKERGKASMKKRYAYSLISLVITILIIFVFLRLWIIASVQ